MGCRRPSALFGGWGAQCACVCLALLVCSCLLAGCGRSPVRLGFLGCLSGSFADLGISGRNGALLAVEECNLEGGVRGRRVELLEADDEASEATAVKALHRLNADGVDGVVGPMISLTAIPVATEATSLGLAVMGPTISTNALTGKRDQFLRVYTPSADTSRTLARLMRTRGARSALVIYDLTNRAHSEGACRVFSEEFVSQGGTMHPEISFFASERPSFTQLAALVQEARPDVVFVIMSTADTALFAQCLSKRGSATTLCCTDWSGSAGFLQLGGRATEGMIFLHSMDKRASGGFVQAYRERFGSEPDFAALRAYEAAWVLLQGLRIDPEPRRLRDTVIAQRRFVVRGAVIEFDEFGDVRREHFPHQVVRGKLEPMAVKPAREGQ